MKTLAAVAVAAAFAFPAVADPPAPVLPPEGDVWHALDTPGFLIVGNAKVDRLETVARDLESLRHVLARIGGGGPGDVRPIPVVVFGDTTAFSPYRAGFGKGADRVTGFFSERGGLKMIALASFKGPGAYENVYHEYLHHVVRTKLGKVPDWFNEGIAGVYETFTCDQTEAIVGRASFDKLRWLNANPWTPLTSLFVLSGAEKLHRESSELTEAFYVESWLLVHDLYFGHPARRAQLAAFLEAYAKGTPHDQAFESSFAGGVAGVEAEVKAYVRGTLPFIRLSFDELKIPEPGEVRTLDRTTVLDTLGELALLSEDSGVALAEAHFRAALAISPQDLRAKAGLGVAALLAGRYDDALTLLGEALDHGFESPLALRAASVAEFHKLDEAHAPRTKDTPVPPAVVHARDLAERAIRADPDDLDLLAEYGSSFVGVRGDPARGIAALERVNAFEPDREDVLHNLLLLYVDRRDRAKAEGVAARIQTVGSAGEKAGARSALAGLDLMESEDALKAGNYELAVALLRSAREGAPREDLKRSIDDRIRWIEGLAAGKKKPPGAAPSALKPQPKT